MAALIPHTFFPRSMFNMDQWMMPTFGVANTLEMFDPFDELDTTIGRNMQWLNKPEFMKTMLPMVPQKYRITLDCAGFDSKCIKFEWKGKCLTVCGKEEMIKCAMTGDFSCKEFKKTYTMPENVECEKMVSFFTTEGMLVMEWPLKETAKHMNTDLFPQIVDENGCKMMKMKFAVPENIKPECIHVTIKDRCLIVKCEDKKIKADGVSKFFFYKKTTLPENCDFDALKCNFTDDHFICVKCPINMSWMPKKVPIECCTKPCMLTK
jgi:HSP20 family molecular chaperone IbpA